MIKVKNKYFDPNKILGIETIKTKHEPANYYVVILFDTGNKDLQKQYFSCDTMESAEELANEIIKQINVYKY